MGILASLTLHARDRDGSHRRHDQGKAASNDRRTARRLVAGLIGACVAASCAAADTPLRIATYTVNLQRNGPGLLFRDITRGAEDVDVTARIIAHVAPDVILLTGFDYDAGGAALAAFAARIGALDGPDYAHQIAVRDNAGLPTGLDVDGDGLLGGPRDAHGYGEFSGQGGLALLSRFPLGAPDTAGVTQTLGTTEGAVRPEGTTDAVWDALRLMERGGWKVKISAPHGRFMLWAAHASPPVFDGPEDRNGLRNAAQLGWWAKEADLEQALPVVLAGDLNNDPSDGEGLKQPLAGLQQHPFFQDPAPTSTGGDLAGVKDGHVGPSALDTVDWTGPGNLRVDYVLPSTHWEVLDAGVFWPAPDTPEAALLGSDDSGASRHRLVWVDLVLKD